MYPTNLAYNRKYGFNLPDPMDVFIKFLRQPEGKILALKDGNLYISTRGFPLPPNAWNIQTLYDLITNTLGKEWAILITQNKATPKQRQDLLDWILAQEPMSKRLGSR